MAERPTRPLRVLYILHSGQRAGSSESLRMLIEHFPEGEVDATVVCPEGEVVPDFQSIGASVRLVPGVSMFHSIAGMPLRGRRLLEVGRTLWLMRYGRHIRAAIRDVRPDIVHLNERGMLHAARIAALEGIPVVMHARSVADRGTSWVTTISADLVRRYVSRVIAIDQSVRRSLRELREVEVIYNPLSSKAVARPSGGNEWRRERAGEPVTVSYLTGLHAFKGIWDLLESARLLRHRGDIRFQIAGGNGRPAPFYRSVRGRLARLAGFAPDVESEVRAWVARSGLVNTVRLLGSLDAGTVLSMTDILVFPSHLNGPGRSVFEAGALGIPAIVALRDRVEDVIVDGETGLIVPDRDPISLAAAIERLADDGDLRGRLGRNAQARDRVQFDPHRSAERVLAVYRGVVRGGAGGRGSPVLVGAALGGRPRARGPA